MTEAVRKLIERLAPNPVCDDCIADRLALADRQMASIIANELAGSSQFERRRCDDEKLTTSQLL